MKLQKKAQPLRVTSKRETDSEFAAVFDIIVRHRARALSDVNVQNLLANWEIGAYISYRLQTAAWGSATVDELVDYIHCHDPKARGYGRRSLYNMVAVYEAFSSSQFQELLAKSGKIVQPRAAQIEVEKKVQPLVAQLPECLEARCFVRICYSFIAACNVWLLLNLRRASLNLRIWGSLNSIWKH